MGEEKGKVVWEQDIRDLILSFKIAVVLSFSLVVINMIQIIARVIW